MISRKGGLIVSQTRATRRAAWCWRGWRRWQTTVTSSILLSSRSTTLNWWVQAVFFDCPDPIPDIFRWQSTTWESCQPWCTIGTPSPSCMREPLRLRTISLSGWYRTGTAETRKMSSRMSSSKALRRWLQLWRTSPSSSVSFLQL